MSAALAFVPVNDVQECYDLIVQNANKTTLVELEQKIRQYWEALDEQTLMECISKR
jgi:hypothetical protein